ncbi:DnaT-like ssDNA-binding domain-containing protein [Pokkaliibacter sp. CJK22405]|uniref:DnaT-like ssDNA-binding domain-containing protein n=1 Tax=Pokkaliibacter sp. CJK22405 TaxID=3384615 RepID=UPI003984BD23
MSFMPEQPMLLYPSLAVKLGVEPALLLGIYHQCSSAWGAKAEGSKSFSLSRAQWLSLAPFWDEDHLATLTQTLVEQGYIEARWEQRQLLRVQLFDSQRPEVPDAAAEAADVEVTERPMRALAQQLREHDSAPVSRPETSSVPATPAPSFGGSVGWPKRNTQSEDALEAIFAKRAQQNQGLHTVGLEWKPGESAVSMLEQHHRVTPEFAMSCLDEFIVYWAETEKRKTAAAWDQAFMKWVKREWVKGQTQSNTPAVRESASKHVQSRERTRENREQVRNSILDINNLDW